MYFLYAVIAVLAYSVQNTFMAKHYRRLDPLVVLTYRGLSMGISMLPLLLFVHRTEWVELPAVFPAIVCGSVTGYASTWGNGMSLRYLPIGVSVALGMSGTAITALVIGLLFFHESISLAQLVPMAVLLGGVFGLGFTKSNHVSDYHYDPIRGSLYCVAYAFFNGLALSFVAWASRQINPFLVGYWWEFGVGIFGLAVMPMLTRKSWASQLSSTDFIAVLKSASATAIGTGFCMLAMQSGPVGIVSAVLATMMVTNSLLAMAICGEHLSRRQWFMIAIVCAAVVILKLVSP